MDRSAVGHHRFRRKQRSRRLIHERHELIRKSRHRTADANTADIGAASDSRHPAPLAHIALDHRTPAPQFYDAGPSPVLLRKLCLLVVSASIAALMHRL